MLVCFCGAGGLLKNMVFGGLDGILTSFAIVAGAAGELFFAMRRRVRCASSF
jgi:hypothetical protein